MNTFGRWCKFNFVGAMGMVVQLVALAILNSLAPGHVLSATAAAVEVAVLHNFVWHRRFTWRDRQDGASTPIRLIRFHLSNGVVSILGNLVLMHGLLHWTRLPLLIANSIAILCCSAVNFLLGDLWSFRAEGEATILNRENGHWHSEERGSKRRGATGEIA